MSAPATCQGGPSVPADQISEVRQMIIPKFRDQIHDDDIARFIRAEAGNLQTVWLGNDIALCSIRL
eukprot:scaffold650973_cov38-Prasinocladus_malaysianus.AAC.1